MAKPLRVVLLCVCYPSARSYHLPGLFLTNLLVALVVCCTLPFLLWMRWRRWLSDAGKTLRARTSVIKENANPVWDETFPILVADDVDTVTIV